MENRQRIMDLWDELYETGSLIMMSWYVFSLILIL